MTNDDHDRADEALKLLTLLAIGEDDDSAAATAVVRAEDWSGYTDDVSIRLRPVYKLLDLCANGWVVLSELTALPKRAAGRLIRSGALITRTVNGEVEVTMAADVALEFGDPSAAGRDADDRRYDVSWLLGLFTREATGTQPAHESAERQEGEAVAPALPGEALTSPLLTIDLDRSELTYHGEKFVVRSEQALRWLQILVNNPGEWITEARARAIDKTLASTRVRDLKSRLPATVLEQIEMNERLGHRFNPALYPRV